MNLTVKKSGINIGTITGGIVNFGGAVSISPISVSKSIIGAGGGNTGSIVITNSR